jgi:hypothetical protein
VELIDTDDSATTLASCSNFNITLTKGNLVDRFSCTVRQGIVYNPRTEDYSDLLSIDKRKRINIYFGHDFSGTIRYERIFTGFMLENPEFYRFGQDDNIQIRGTGLGYLLDKSEGDYTYDLTYTGTSKDLIEYWLDQLGITYVLTYTDNISYDDEEIVYDSMLSGINTILDALGPKVEAYFTPKGVFIMRDKSEAITPDIEFNYDSANILKLRRYTDIDKIITVASVVGDSDTSSATGEASSIMINKYGRNTQTISSGLITTSAVANQLVEDILDEGEKYQNEYEIEVAMNPYIWTNSLINIDEEDISNITDTMVRCHSINHGYRGGSQQMTRIRGYDG